MKKEVPQLNHRGLSWDYLNEITALDCLIQFYLYAGDKEYRKCVGLNSQDYIFEKIKLIDNYQKRFSQYENVVNEGNKKYVVQIDFHAKRLNSLLESKCEDIKLLKQECDEIYFVIHGARRKG